MIAPDSGRTTGGAGPVEKPGKGGEAAMPGGARADRPAAAMPGGRGPAGAGAAAPRARGPGTRPPGAARRSRGGRVAS